MEERLYNYWEKGFTTPIDFDELIQKLIKVPVFLRFLQEFVDQRVSQDFKDRNDNP
jgi:hypothetical protein